MATNEKDRFGDKLRDAERAREDLYFAEQDRRLLDKMREAKGEDLEAHVREAALMRCPKCGVRLEHTHEHGVAVDECPQCKGVWLTHEYLQEIAGREGEGEGWIARWLRGEFRKPE